MTMIAPKIKKYDLWFTSLAARVDTDLIIVHHTGNPWDDDLSAEDIHRMHQAEGWSGCGYHYIVRKNGEIEEGRPEWAIGSHALGYNSHSIGVHICGNFEIATPTDAQIESASYLIGWLCDRYGLIGDADHIVGHRDLMATLCPGQNLYDILRVIRGKSIWYAQNYQGGD